MTNFTSLEIDLADVRKSWEKSDVPIEEVKGCVSATLELGWLIS